MSSHRAQRSSDSWYDLNVIRLCPAKLSKPSGNGRGIGPGPVRISGTVLDAGCGTNTAANSSSCASATRNRARKVRGEDGNSRREFASRTESRLEQVTGATLASRLGGTDNGGMEIPGRIHNGV